jgi:hypothetical protein
MKLSTYLLGALMILTGCTISQSTHMFEYYGSDSLRDDSDFFYVRHGVSGSSSASYDNNGGGAVRSGLIADAKANMLDQHILGPNQSYINMSVDIITTKTGYAAGGTMSVTDLTITCVVSADIIEYGIAPISNPATNTANRTTGHLPNVDNHTPNSNTVSIEEPTVAVPTSFEKGEIVIYTDRKNEVYDATIRYFSPSYKQYSIEFVNLSGKTKKRYVYPYQLSKKEINQEN